MSDLEQKLRQVLGALGRTVVSGAAYPYQADFVSSGVRKGRHIADDLTALAETEGARLALDRCGYLSVGGGDGAEIEYVMSNTPIRYGVLLDFNPDLYQTARQREDALRSQGKSLEVIIGDVSQQISECRKRLERWRSQGLIDGLVTSAQAVLHELPLRSPGFDIDNVLGEMFWDWAPCLFYCREPCHPEGWPEQVKLSVGAPPIARDLLEDFAKQIQAYLGIQGRVHRAGPRHITLPAVLAVETLTKLFYLEDYKHEIGEQATWWRADKLTLKVQDVLGPDSIVKHETLATDSFEKRYKDFRIEARDAEGKKLPLPRVFVRIRAIRWRETAEPVVAEPVAPAEVLPVGTRIRSVDETAFARLLAEGETQKVDRKLALALDTEDAKSKFVKDVAALANTNPANVPAFLLIGIHPKTGELAGVASHPDDAVLQQLVRSKLQPAPNFLYYPIACQGKSFGIVEIRATREPCQAIADFGVVKSGVFYTRKGTRNSEASLADLDALRHERDRHFRTATRQAEPPPELPKPPEPAPDLSPSGPPVDQLAQGQEVVVRFQPQPSRTWKDPVGIIEGVWNAAAGKASPVRWPLLCRRRPGDAPIAIGAEPRLCIPSLDVEVEWRERAFVQGPVWSRIKEQVVRQFVRGLGGKPVLGTVASVGSNERGPYLHLHCSAYDLFLTVNWPFYRGIVAALTKNGSHKRPEIQRLLEAELRDWVAGELVATGSSSRPSQRNTVPLSVAARSTRRAQR